MCKEWRIIVEVLVTYCSLYGRASIKKGGGLRRVFVDGYLQLMKLSQR